MSKMAICKTCSKEIAKSAKVCPNCGAKNKKGFLKKLIGGLFILVVLIVVITSLNGGKSSGIDQYIDIVKTGYLGNYKSVTISKVLETNFPNCKWDSFQSKGKNIVQVNAEEVINNKTNKLQIQFAVEKDNTFNVVNFKVNDEVSKQPYETKLVLDTLYDQYSKKVSDKSVHVDVETDNDTLKGTPSDKYKK